MNVITDIPLNHFKFWGYARDVSSTLTTNELLKIDAHFSKDKYTCYSKSKINNIFTFELDLIAKILGTTKEECEKGVKSPSYILKIPCIFF